MYIGAAGFPPPHLYGDVAQLGERLPCKQEVAGSSPVVSTNFSLGVGNVFEVGDRVECIVDCPDDNEDIYAGYLGTVCEEPEDSGDDQWIGVCWDEDVGGHDCSGNCEDGHGWRVYASQLVLHQECDDKPFPFDEKEFKELLGMG